MDAQLHAQPVKFSSPLFFNPGGRKKNFDRVAFETNLPRIETNTNPPCQRHLSNPADPSPGQGCVNPAAGADFYPIYTTRQGEDDPSCRWQLGGAYLKNTTQTFGGTSAAEYGALTASFYPATDGQPQYLFENFHRNLRSNPCPAGVSESDD